MLKSQYVLPTDVQIISLETRNYSTKFLQQKYSIVGALWKSVGYTAQPSQFMEKNNNTEYTPEPYLSDITAVMGVFSE